MLYKLRQRDHATVDWVVTFTLTFYDLVQLQFWPPIGVAVT